MLRLVFFLIILIHGLLHLLGFAKGLNLADVPQLSGKTIMPLSTSLSRIASWLWGITCIFFLLSGNLFFFKNEYWGWFGALAIILSQILIIVYWKDAKAGTIANIIILPAVIVSIAGWNFKQNINKEIKTILSEQSTPTSEIVGKESLTNLPYPVQNWLMHSGVVGKEKIHSVRLHQSGSMLTKPGGKWMPAVSEQYFTVDNPAFLWSVKMEMNSFLSMTGRDKFENGKGSMNIKALSLITVAKDEGEKIDQGTMLRYLAEIVWFPSAAFNEYMKWESIDSLTAKATLTYKGLNVSGIFSFDQIGNVIAFEAKRYGNFNGAYSMETWHINCREPRNFSGIIIPSKSDVTWKLKDGDFTWFKMEIKDIEYNQQGLFPD